MRAPFRPSIVAEFYNKCSCFIGDICGQTNVNITQPVPFTLDIPDFRFFECRWFITSPLDTFIYVDVVHISISYPQKFSFARVVGSYGNQTTLMDEFKLDRTAPNGTSFYFSGNNITMSFSSPLYVRSAPSLRMILHSEDDQGNK